VHFDFDKSNIRPDARPILDEAVRMLKQRGEVKIVVEGHTDSVGSDGYNMKLSRRRADAVKRYLVEHGIAASRITTEGFGKRQPVASNATAEGRAQNRRVEIHVQ
jgi:outer membrane protein OmpA-like peptidoglycan-associated protein